MKATKAWVYIIMKRFEILFIQNIVGNDWCGGCIRSIPHIPPGFAPDCIITKDGLKFKRDVLNRKYRRQLRHDCCKEGREMLSGETGKTIFKCLQLSSFLSYSTYINVALNCSVFFLERCEGPRAVACTGAAALPR